MNQFQSPRYEPGSKVCWVVKRNDTINQINCGTVEYVTIEPPFAPTYNLCGWVDAFAEDDLYSIVALPMLIDTANKQP